MDGERQRGPGPIPKRWLQCPCTSSTIIIDKFLAFKTPLNARFDTQIPSECIFQPERVFSLMKFFKKKMGLWIDLTNTKRFYDRREVETRDCQYTKLSCRGHGETPSPDQTQAFIELVDQFVTEQPLSVVGVHCTHGFNRTGFLIVAYMVERMDISVDAALGEFAKARPPGIYKGDYIKELYRRYDDEEDAPPPPALPDWCYEEDEDDEPQQYEQTTQPTQSSTQKRSAKDDENDLETNGECSTNTDGDGLPKKKRRKEFLNLNATFMTGVGGVVLVTDQPRLGELQGIVQDMCGWTGTGFPGCQPVSMDRQNIQLLQRKPYRVSWKADGTRYMMLIQRENEIYFFDRDNSVFQVEGLRFPVRENLDEHLFNTLIDGEMVIDIVNGLSVPRFLVYDVIRYNDEPYMNRPFFPDRLSCIKDKIVEGRYRAMRHGVINKEREPFSVRDKGFWDLECAGKLLEPKFQKNLSHEPDGLIFQPSSDPYMPGRCDDVLKWKPSDMNSVDFKMKIFQESGQGLLTSKVCLLLVGHSDVPFSQMKYKKQYADLNGKIIECKFENNQWVFMRERTDKSFPNSFETAKAVCKSIAEPVTSAYLLQFIEQNRYRDDSQRMPPPPSFQRH